MPGLAFSAFYRYLELVVVFTALEVSLSAGAILGELTTQRAEECL